MRRDVCLRPHLAGEQLLMPFAAVGAHAALDAQHGLVSVYGVLGKVGISSKARPWGGGLCHKVKQACKPAGQLR